MLLVLAITLADGIMITMVMPVAPDMVRSFGVKEIDVGYSAGMLASSYNFAQCIMQIFWGRRSDLIGRRPVIAVGLVGSAVGVVLLGFSDSLIFAMACRMLGGALNATQPVLRAMLRELLPPQHRTRGFATLGQAWGIGFLVGPLISGALSYPAEWAPALRGSPLDTHPFLLACCVAALGSFLGLAMLWRLPETCSRAALSREDQPRDGRAPSSGTELALADETLSVGKAGDANAYPSCEPERGSEAAHTSLVATTMGSSSCSSCNGSNGGGRNTGSNSSDGDDAPTGTAGHNRGGRCGGSTLLAHARRTRSRLRRAVRRSCAQTAEAFASLRERPIQIAILLTMLNHFVVIGMAELVPLYATSPDGLRLTPREVALALTPLAFMLLVWPFAFVAIERRYGCVTTLVIGLSAFLVVNLLVRASCGLARSART